MKYFTLVFLLLFASNLFAQTLIAPQIVSATGVSPEHISILYVDTNLDESTYSLAYSTTSADGPWIEDFAGVSNTTSGETFETILQFESQPSTTFYIKMRALAMDENWEVIAASPYSDIVTATTTEDYPIPAADFAATPKSNGNHIQLTWTDVTPEGSTGDEYAWLIWRRDALGINQINYTIEGGTTSFTDKNVEKDLMYTYYLEAVNEYHNGREVLGTSVTVSDREKKKDSFVYPNPTNFGSVTVNVDNGYNNSDALVTIHDETGLIWYWATVTVTGNRFVLDAFQTLPEGSWVLNIRLSDGFQWGGEWFRSM